jgi:hypothetical protein
MKSPCPETLNAAPFRGCGLEGITVIPQTQKTKGQNTMTTHPKTLLQPIRLVWFSCIGKTNGIRHTYHHATYSEGVHPAIFEAEDMDCVVLSINGYQFDCASVEAAKFEAEERITNNRGVYLPQI